VVAEAGHPLTVREIGERLVCESGSPSRLVASVVDAGLLERGERAGDRRAVELSLTGPGRAAVEDVRRVEKQLHDRLASSLSQRERTALVRALGKLAHDRPAGNAIARRG
jgi:MarR family transcriptional regulator, organic hydroperoxide resistance regulator